MKITQYDICANLNKNYKFAFVSDLHGCDNQPIIEKIKEILPDALLVGGDFIHDKDNYKRGLSFLEEASKIVPVFCSLGNHEFRFDEDMRPKIKNTGVTLLDNSLVQFEEICIGGLTSPIRSGAKKDKDASKRVPDLKWLNKFDKAYGYKLLLCHHPEYFVKYIKKTSIDLTLSGHAHGGQWRIFGNGIYAPGQGILPKYTSGIHFNRLIVGRGLGNPHLIPRINNKPEFIVINITKNP